MSTVKVTMYQEFTISNVRDELEAVEIAKGIVEDQIGTFTTNCFICKAERVIQYSNDPEFEKDNKARKAKAFIKEIIDACTKYDMIIVPSDQVLVSSVGNEIHENGFNITNHSIKEIEEILLESIDVNNINL